MDLTTIIVSAVSFLGTLVTVLCSNHSTKKVVAYQIEAIQSDISRLEQKQDKHNGLIERMARAEESIKSAHHRIAELKKEE